MKPDSKELAYQIDVMVAFQNKEDIQFREISSGRLDAVEAKWQLSFGNLAFDWGKHEYRRKPVTPREGFIFERLLHQHPHPFNTTRETKDGTCFLVREVLDNE